MRPVDLQGKTLGVLGMGGIGQALAPRAKAMGMRVLGTSRRSREVPEGVDRMYRVDEAVDMVAGVGLRGRSGAGHAGDGGHCFQKACSRRSSAARSYWTVRGVRGCTTIERWNWRWRRGKLGGVCFQPAGDSPGMPPEDSDFWKRDNVVVTTCRGTSSEQEDLCLGVVLRESSAVRVRAIAVGVGGQNCGVLRVGEVESST